MNCAPYHDKVPKFLAYQKYLVFLLTLRWSLDLKLRVAWLNVDILNNVWVNLITCVDFRCFPHILSTYLRDLIPDILAIDWSEWALIRVLRNLVSVGGLQNCDSWNLVNLRGLLRHLLSLKQYLARLGTLVFHQKKPVFLKYFYL